MTRFIQWELGAHWGGKDGAARLLMVAARTTACLAPTIRVYNARARSADVNAHKRENSRPNKPAKITIFKP
jgi:hypothetical protein